MKIKTLGIALSFIVLSACNQDGGGQTTLEGSVENSDVIYVSLLSPMQIEKLDTVELTDSRFSYTFEVDSIPNFYAVETPDGYGLPLFIAPGEKVELTVTGDKGNRKYEVSGSEESERILKVTDILRDAMAEVDRLDSLNQSAMDSTNFMSIRMKSDSILKHVTEETSQKYKSMIDEEPGRMSNLFIFSQGMGRTPMITPQDDMEYFEKVLVALKEKYPNHPHVVNFDERIGKIKEALAAQEELDKVKESLQPGSPVPNISMTDPNGNMRSLDDLKGKVVLVDFWAAWCRPCRAENPNLVRMYKEYKNKGFDVFSVSLDGLPQQPNPKQDWEEAINQDGLIWANHVSDLQGWNSGVVPKFGFNGIPYTVLVDREGNIIATELRGPTLEAKLKEILGS